MNTTWGASCYPKGHGSLQIVISNNNFNDRHRVLKTWSVYQIWVYMWPVLAAKPLGSPTISLTHTPVYSRAWKKHPWFPIVILSVKLVDL